MKSTHASLIVLFLLILLIGIFGRIWKLWEIESVKAKELTPKIEQLKKENENLKNENNILKKETQRPIRDRILAEIHKVFGSRAKEALAIIQCENNPNNPNYDPFRIHVNKDGSKDHGVFQIHARTWVKVYGDEFMNNWKENIKVAKKIFDRSGTWRQWYSSQNCHGLAYAQN